MTNPTTNVREPAVAGRFYPASPERLRRDVQRYLHDPEAEPSPAIAVVGPHAGFMFSGRTAGRVFARVSVPDHVVVLGPNHTGRGRPLALYPPGGTWRMPFGDVRIDDEIGPAIAEIDVVEIDVAAHSHEHGIEAHVPFLQLRNDAARLTALVTSAQSYGECAAIGESLAAIIRARSSDDGPADVLLSASTDMTHFLPADAARAQDELAIERILELDPEGLYEVVRRHRISMCGVVPTTIVLVAANALGARTAELVEYTHSGVVSGDFDRVVGYAGLVIR